MIYFAGQPLFNQDPNDDVMRNQTWDDIESMNEDLISYWNETVDETNIVFVLGGFQDSKNSEIPGYTYRELINRLNGRICHVYHRKDEEQDPAEYTEICVLDTMIQYDRRTIHITNFLEHINRIESNLVITSCGNFLPRESRKSLYFKMHGSFIFQNNITNPVYNVNIDIWDYKPVSIETILNKYSLYLKQHEEL